MGLGEQRLSRRTVCGSIGALSASPLSGAGSFSPLRPDPLVRWRYRERTESGMIPTATDGERVYAIADDSLVALASDDGSEQWRYEETRSGILPRWIGRENVYAVHIGGPGFVALDPETGTVRWRNSVADVPLVTETQIFVGDETLYAHSPADGTIDWAFDLPNGVTSKVTTTDTVFVGCEGSLHAVRREDGSERWRFEVSDPDPKYWYLRPLEVDIESSQLFAWDTEEETVLSLNVDDGRELWRYEVDAASVLFPGVLTEGTALFVEAADLVSVALSDGTERWRIEFDEELHPDLQILGDSVVVRTRRRAICLAIEDGTQRWEILTDRPIRGFDADGDVILVVGEESEPKRALRFSGTDGSLLWALEDGTEHLHTLPAAGKVYVGTEGGLWLLETATGPVAEAERIIGNGPAGLLAGGAALGVVIAGAYKIYDDII